MALGGRRMRGTKCKKRLNGVKVLTNVFFHLFIFALSSGIAAFNRFRADISFINHIHETIFGLPQTVNPSCALTREWSR